MSTIKSKKINRSIVYKTIYKYSEISKKQIMSKLNMSAPTITYYLNELLNENLVIYGDLLKSTGGRKAQSFSCNYDAYFSIGIDITPSRLGGVLVNLAGDIKDTLTLNIPFLDTPNYYCKVAEVIKALCSTQHIKKNILGVGVSVPAIVDKSGRTIHFAPLIHASNLIQSLEESINLPVKLFNDANAGGLAELWYLKDTTNMVYLSLSNTVGSAILLNNHLYYGDNALSGEVGHMMLHPNGKLCYCGKRGCVDPYCSTFALTSGKCDLDTFFKKLQSGEQKIEERWSAYLDNISLVINNIHHMLDCKVILGGLIGSHLQDNLPIVRKRVSSLDIFSSDLEYIQSCILKNEASATGAALYFIDLFINSV